MQLAAKTPTKPAWNMRLRSLEPRYKLVSRTLKKYCGKQKTKREIIVATIKNKIIFVLPFLKIIKRAEALQILQINLHLDHRSHLHHRPYHPKHILRIRQQQIRNHLNVHLSYEASRYSIHMLHLYFHPHQNRRKKVRD